MTFDFFILLFIDSQIQHPASTRNDQGQHPVLNATLSVMTSSSRMVKMEAAMTSSKMTPSEKIQSFKMVAAVTVKSTPATAGDQSKISAASINSVPGTTLAAASINSVPETALISMSSSVGMHFIESVVGVVPSTNIVSTTASVSGM